MTTLTPTQILDRALEILDAPEKWTQEYEARDINRSRCSVNHPDAASFCTIGATARAFFDLRGMNYGSYAPYDAALDIIRDLIVDDTISVWNDAPERTFEQVRAVIAQARDLSRQQEEGG